MLRYHPDDPRSCMGGYEGSLTQDEEDALHELQSATDGMDLSFVRGDYGEAFDGGDHAVEPLRLCLLRFLRGNAFNVNKALSQLEDCVEHRRQNPTDKLLSKTPREILACNVDEFNSFYPRWLMGYDKLGRPILVTRYGSLRLWEMTKLTTIECMTELHAREQELLLRLLRRRTMEGGGNGKAGRTGGEGGAGGGKDGPAERPHHIVDTAVIVIDTAGLTLRHVTKAFVRLFKMRARMDQLLFPEMLGKCFIVNTPSLFSYVWAMFSPLLDERTRSKISITAKPEDWMKDLQEIADLDQLSPEYGGTGARQEDLPPLADALYAAGSRGPDRNGYPVPDDGRRGRDSGGDGDIEAAKRGVVPGHRRAPLPPRARPNLSGPPEGYLEREKEEVVPSSGSERRGWLGASGAEALGPFAWLWSAWGGSGGGVSEGGGMRGVSEGSVVTSDEEFFDALAELDLSHRSRGSSGGGGGETRARGRSRLRSESGGTGAGAARSRDDADIEVGRSASSPESTTRNAVWRRSWGGTPADLAELSTPISEGGVARSGSATGFQGRHGGGGGGDRAAGGMLPRLQLSGVLGWCYEPVLLRLNRKGVDQLARWLCFAIAVSASLAVAVVVVGAFSLFKATVLGLEWCAVTAVCLGSLLLLLALLGAAGARLRNRFSLLGFAALEGAVAFGMLLSGTWCLALAGGSATLSDLTWEAMNREREVSGTKEEFLIGAKSRLLYLGATGLVLALFSVVGPCLLASVLLGKIRNMEQERERRDYEKLFGQLRRSALEANGLCTIFAFVCTGYGGYALSFTVSLGLGANITSTYLLVAGGYILLLAGAVGAWAARSGRPDAFRIHFGALLPAGVLYASLTVVQLVSVRPSDERVAQAWEDLHAEGESLYSVQTNVRTMLIVSGVLSAVTFALVVCAAVASRAARNALLLLPESSSRRHCRQARLSRGEKLVAAWALALAATCTFIDGSFAVFSAWLARDKEQAGLWLLAMWEGMGRGDGRYVEGDTFIVATAIIVATIVGPGALLYAWAVYCRKGFRFSVGILVSTASIHTQLLRYVTSADSAESRAEPGSKAFFIGASLVLSLLQVAGALAVLIFNVRRMTTRVHAAEVHYRALLLEHDRLSGKFEAKNVEAEGGGVQGQIRGGTFGIGRNDERGYHLGRYTPASA